MKIFFLTGKPACGKDTQADLLCKKFRAKKIITSEQLQKVLKNLKGKYLKLDGVPINIAKQRKTIKAGKLVAYRLVGYVIEKILAQALKNKQSLVFSGSPRSIYEAKKYLKLLGRKSQIPVSVYFIYIKISDQEATKRSLLRRRQFLDTAAVIKERLRVFNKEVMPVIEYLRAQKLLLEVDGAGNPQAVFQRLSLKLPK